MTFNQVYENNLTMAGRSGIDWYKRKEAKSPLKIHIEEADKPFE
jgi:hypothetical protein